MGTRLLVWSSALLKEIMEGMKVLRSYLRNRSIRLRRRKRVQHSKSRIWSCVSLCRWGAREDKCLSEECTPVRVQGKGWKSFRISNGKPLSKPPTPGWAGIWRSEPSCWAGNHRESNLTSISLHFLKVNFSIRLQFCPSTWQKKSKSSLKTIIASSWP